MSLIGFGGQIKIHNLCLGKGFVWNFRPFEEKLFKRMMVRMILTLSIRKINGVGVVEKEMALASSLSSFSKSKFLTLQKS